MLFRKTRELFNQLIQEELVNVIDNSHFERIQQFIAGEDNAYVKLRHEKKSTIGNDNPLPWRMELFIGDDCIYYTAAENCPEVFKRVSNKVHEIQATKSGPGSRKFDSAVNSDDMKKRYPTDIGRVGHEIPDNSADHII